MNARLARVEQVKRFEILEEDFRQDRDEVTPAGSGGGADQAGADART